MNRIHAGTARSLRTFAGLLIAGLGVVHLLANLRIISVSGYAAQYWPAICIAVGLRQMIFRDDGARWVSGIFWTATGLLFLAATMRYISAAIPAAIWPLMVIWLGLYMLVRQGKPGNGQPGGLR